MFVTYVSYTLLKVALTVLDTHNIKNDDLCKSTKVLLRDFRNLKSQVKFHFENEVHLKNDCDLQKKGNS